MKLLLNTHKKIKSAILTASAVVSNVLFAELPTTSNPSTDPAAGDYIGLRGSGDIPS